MNDSTQQQLPLDGAVIKTKSTRASHGTGLSNYNFILKTKLRNKPEAWSDLQVPRAISAFKLVLLGKRKKPVLSADEVFEVITSLGCRKESGEPWAQSEVEAIYRKAVKISKLTRTRLVTPIERLLSKSHTGRQTTHTPSKKINTPMPPSPEKVEAVIEKITEDDADAFLTLARNPLISKTTMSQILNDLRNGKK